MKSVVKSAKTIDLAINACLEELNVDLDDCKITILEHPKAGIFGIIGQKDAVVKLELKEDKNQVSDFVEKALDKKDKEKEEKEEKKSVNIEEPKKHVYISKNNKRNNINKSNNKKKEEKVQEEKKEVVQKVSKEESKEKIDINDEKEKVQEFVENFVSKLMDSIHIDAEITVEVEGTEVYVNLGNVEDKDVGVAIGSKAETLNALQYITALALNKNVENYYRVFLNIAGYRERRKIQIENLAVKRAKKVLKTKKSSALKPMNSYERKIVHFALQNIEGIETVSEGKDPYRKVVIKYTK